MTETHQYCRKECHHCEGMGCMYCDTQGWVWVRVPARECRWCDGVGCIYCGFTGWAGLKPKYGDEE